MADYNYLSLTFQHPHVFDDILNSDDRLGEDLPNLNWNMSNIEPSLDGFSFQNDSISNPPMSSYQQHQAQQQRAQGQQQQNHQQNQHPTMQRFVNEPQRQFFTAPIIPREFFHGGLSHTSIPTSCFPRASHQRMASPSLSHDLTSTSAASPPADQDFYPDNSYYRMDNNYYTNSLPNLQGGPASYQAYALPHHQGFSCVSMDQVQSFADTGNASYENTDEGFGQVPMKPEYGMEVDRHYMQCRMETSGETQGFRYPSDEGIGISVQDEGSPKNTILFDESRMPDMEAKGDLDDMDAEQVPSTPASDTEYLPRATRTRKPHASPNTKAIAQTTKGHRITKALPKSKGQATCSSCAHAPFKDARALQRHFASAHTRAYVCVFNFAGCPSTFASKNEWKRHVNSQHLNLTAWVCDLGSCGRIYSKAEQPVSAGDLNDPTIRCNEFNRKDLFTQHLRRMHAPAGDAVKRKKSTGPNNSWEETIKTLQKTCIKAKRQAPTQLACHFHGCTYLFSGTGCWDDLMEHVAKHLEAQARAQSQTVLRQGDDALLCTWALQEGIIESQAGGGYRLVPGPSAYKGKGIKDDDEEDAEGEDE